MWETVSEVFKAAILSGNVFVVLSTVILFLTGMSIWFLVVLNVNRNIAHKRKAKGMVAVEQSITFIFNTMNDHYLLLADMYLKDDYFYGFEYSTIKFLYNLALGERRDRFRERIRMNGFEDKTSLEWNLYKKEAITEDFGCIKEYMDHNYHPKCEIPRNHTKATREKWGELPDLADWNKNILPPIKDELDGLLEYLLDLAKTNKFKRFFGWRIMFGVY